MMFHALRGLGQTPADFAAVTPTAPDTTGSTATLPQDPEGAWCLANPTLASFDPMCLIDYLEGGYSSTVQSPAPPMITAAYNAGSTAIPPSQAYIESNTPSDTINQILTSTQTNAVANATAAAAAQAAANAPANPTPLTCLASPNSVACWLASNETMLLIGGAAFIALYALSVLKPR